MKRSNIDWLVHEKPLRKLLMASRKLGIRDGAAISAYASQSSINRSTLVWFAYVNSLIELTAKDAKIAPKLERHLVRGGSVRDFAKQYSAEYTKLCRLATRLGFEQGMGWTKRRATEFIDTVMSKKRT